METIKRPAAEIKLRLQRARADHTWVDVTFRTFRRFGEDEGGTLAAALTYYTFFSIFPLLLLAVSLLGYVTFGNESLQQELIRSGLRTVPLLRDALSPNGLELIMDRKGSLALTGLALALYSGSGAIVALEHGLNRIHHVADEPNWVQKRLRSLVWLGILGLAAIASLGLGIVSGAAPGVLAAITATIGALLLNVGIFATAYRVLPKKDLSWREVLPGAIVAAVVFEILRFVGTAYLAQGETTRNATFGTSAAAAALLIASYLIAQITLLAAEVNAVLAERRATRDPFRAN